MYVDLLPEFVGLILTPAAIAGCILLLQSDHPYRNAAAFATAGLGAANFGSGLCTGMVVNGSLSKTAVNGSAGARSQVSGLVVALLTVVTLLLVPFIDVTAARMLDEAGDDLVRAARQRLVVAHDLGQVGDLLDNVGSTELSVFRTIEEAIADVHASHGQGAR